MIEAISIEPGDNFMSQERVRLSSMVDLALGRWVTYLHSIFLRSDQVNLSPPLSVKYSDNFQLGSFCPPTYVETLNRTFTLRVTLWARRKPLSLLCVRVRSCCLQFAVRQKLDVGSVSWGKSVLPQVHKPSPTTTKKEDTFPCIGRSHADWL